MTWVKARRLRPERIWGGLARRNRLVSAWGVGGDRWMLLFVREGEKVEPLVEGRLTPEWGGDQ